MNVQLICRHDHVRVFFEYTLNSFTGHIVSAVWSPCGSVLLFATDSEPVIYALNFGSSSASAAIPVVNVDAVAFDDGLEDNEVQIGGVVKSLALDPLGERLAVAFEKTDLIAVFAVGRNYMALTPIGFIRGQVGERPASMDFSRRSRENDGAVLGIGWSTGRLQFVPFLFVADVRLSNNLIVDDPIIIGNDLDCSLANEQQHAFTFTEQQ